MQRLWDELFYMTYGKAAINSYITCYKASLPLNYYDKKLWFYQNI